MLRRIIPRFAGCWNLASPRRSSKLHGLTDTLAELRREPVDLVLINRKLDADDSDGMEILAAIKADAAAGPRSRDGRQQLRRGTSRGRGGRHVPGFGKAELSRPDTLEKLHSMSGWMPPIARRRNASTDFGGFHGWEECGTLF